MIQEENNIFNYGLIQNFDEERDLKILLLLFYHSCFYFDNIVIALHSVNMLCLAL